MSVGTRPYWPDVMKIEPRGPVRGSVRVPGSKSHTNRSLVIAALAGGTSRLEGALFADDTLAMASGLEALGFKVERDGPGRRFTVEGKGGEIPAGRASIDARDAGTVMRFLAAAAALGRGGYVVDGSARMRERPIGDLADGLVQLGAEVRFLETEGFPPVEVRSEGISGVARIPGRTSSQFASAILLASPCAKGKVRLEIEGEIVSLPFIELTVGLMSGFGAEVGRPDRGVFEVEPTGYRAGVHFVAGDATAASYFLAAAAVTGGRVTVENVGTSSLQGDAGFAGLLERMGCRVERRADSTTVEGTECLRGVSADMGATPDLVPTLAVAALFASTPTEIRNVANLRVKESDRLAALARELPKLGAEVRELPDGLVIRPARGKAPLRGAQDARMATYNDHRLAMSFAVAALATDGVEIENPRCVEKTYPGFFQDLESVGA